MNEAVDQRIAELFAHVQYIFAILFSIDLTVPNMGRFQYFA